MTITVYNVMPIPPDEAATHFVDAGALRIGVEYRFLDVAGLEEAYEGDDAAEIAAATPAGLEDEGVSIHVFGDDGLEYLRFDMFDGGPHYHYIAHEKGENVIVDYDRVAFGEMLPWGVDCATGVEGDDYRKDRKKMTAFVEAVRRAEDAGSEGMKKPGEDEA